MGPHMVRQRATQRKRWISAHWRRLLPTSYCDACFHTGPALAQLADRNRVNITSSRMLAQDLRGSVPRIRATVSWTCCSSQA